MSRTTAVALRLEEAQIEDAPPPSVWRALIGSWEGRIGIGLAAAIAFVILLGPALAPYGPDEIGTGLSLAPPSGSHLLGTDSFGRDILSRVLSGGRSVILVPLAAVTLAYVIGGSAGMLGAYRRGAVDTIITRTFDLFLTLPPLLIVLVVIAGLGTSMVVVIITVALVYVPFVGRVVRGATQAAVTSDYVAAAQARGESTRAILARELLPNVAAPLIADFALRITYAIIFIATLSFLGLGAQPPSADWGLMVASNRGFMTAQPWATVAPMIGIAALSIAFNLIANTITRHVTRD